MTIEYAILDIAAGYKIRRIDEYLKPTQADLRERRGANSTENGAPI
jgi:hypothetical protein